MLMRTMGPVERLASAQKIEVIECDTRLYSCAHARTRNLSTMASAP